MAGPYTIRDATYTGLDPDPVEWANQDIKPAIIDLDLRAAALEAGGVGGSVGYVEVLTGLEERPDQPFVIWVDMDELGSLNALSTDLIITPGSSEGGGGVTGSVFFEGTNVAGGSISGDGFNTYTINNIVTNIGGGSFNTTTCIFTIPSNGLYDCQATIRSTDNATARSLGIGIGTSNADASHFFWGSFGGSGSFSRNGTQYRRLTRFTAGDQVRLYIYSEGTGFTVNTGYLAIMKVAD
jgi:hypothetical protein